MTLSQIAASQWLSAFFVAGVAWVRPRRPSTSVTPQSERPALPVGHPNARERRLGLRPTTATHQIAAFTLDGQPLPDVYLGNDDRDVKRKWAALKQRQNAGHWELWHRSHGWRDSITRHPSPAH